MQLRPEPVMLLDCLTVAARECTKWIKREVDEGLDPVITPPRPDSILLQRMSPIVWHVLTQKGPSQPAASLASYSLGTIALADGGRLVVSGVPADHGEREVPGVADIDDRQ